MFKSLRWRLQLWHAIVLLAVLTSFGAIVYGLLWQTRLQQVDSELDRTAGVVMSQLRRLLPRPPGGRRPRRPENPRPEADANPAESDANVAARMTPGVEIDAPKPHVAAPRGRFDPGPLPDEFQQLFHGEEDSRHYFLIWAKDGELLQKSESAPAIDYPNLHVGADGLPIRTVRLRSDNHLFREVIHAGFFDMNLLVGRSLQKDLAAQYQS